MRCGRLGALPALALLVGAMGGARGQEKGLHLQLVSSPAPGRVRAFIDASSTIAKDARLDAKDFSIVLPGGTAGGLKVSRNRTEGGMTSIVLVDISGSYKGLTPSEMKSSRAAKVAFPAIRSYAQKLAFPTDQIALVQFAASGQSLGAFNDLDAFLARLTQMEQATGKGRTNLVDGLNAALKAAPSAPGRVEILLFTDAGDEAGDVNGLWAQLTGTAVKHGVRVSVVTVGETPRDFRDGNRPQLWLDSKNRLKTLAQTTHGAFIDARDPAQVETDLATDRENALSWVVVEGALCGDGKAAELTARVEYAPAGSYTATEKFAPLWEPTTASCAAAGTCAKACADWQECAGGSCEPRRCSANELCPPSAQCGADKKCAQIAAATPKWWMWALAGGGLLLIALGLFFVLRRKKPEPVWTPPAVEEQVAPPPVPEPPPPSPPEPILDFLPETHLVAVAGPLPRGERWRLHKRRMQAGGSSDPADGNDIILAIQKVSGKHALFELFPSGDLWVTDLNSTNGTFVDGRRLDRGERARLKVGSQVKLSQVLTLEVARPGAEATPPAGDAAPPAGETPPISTKGRTMFDPGNR